MHSDDTVRQVFRLRHDGHSQAAIAGHVGIARATVRDWLNAGESAVLARPMRQHRACGTERTRCPLSLDLDECSYAYMWAST